MLTLLNYFEYFNKKKFSGRPFLYFCYGASVTEVTIDTLTGENIIDQVDILQDAGKAINPALELGQIEGGFVQGQGWLTMEEVNWKPNGQITTISPSTYKIPAASDIPKILPELDVFLITSETEGLGTSVIDAFVCEVPVVATKAGGIPELVKHKTTGLLAEVKDAKVLADHINLLFSGSIDLKEITNNQQELLTEFTREVTAEKTLIEYYSIL